MKKKDKIILGTVGAIILALVVVLIILLVVMVPKWKRQIYATISGGMISMNFDKFVENADEMGEFVKTPQGSETLTLYKEDGSYTVYEYDEDEKWLKLTQYNGDGTMLLCNLLEFDKDGDLVKDTGYREDGTLLDVSVYNEKGYLESITSFSTEGIAGSKMDFDRKGNIYRTTYYNEDGSIYCIWEFDSKGNIVDETYY